jgi:hypothetical protein
MAAVVTAASTIVRQPSLEHWVSADDIDRLLITRSYDRLLAAQSTAGSSLTLLNYDTSQAATQRSMVRLA